MTNEEARRILTVYRPDGEDADNPFFADALRHAERDPEMGRWLDDERRFDRSVSAALHRIEIPSDAKRQLLAASRLESRVRRIPYRVTALAAALVLASGLLFAWLAFGPSDRGGEVYAGDDAIRSFAELTARAMPFEYRADSVSALSAWLEGSGAPFPNGLPEAMAAAEAVGCQIFTGADGGAISLLCLVLNGEFLHLFVMDEGSADFARVSQHTWTAESGWNAYSWSREGRGYVAMSRAPRSELEPWFDEV